MDGLIRILQENDISAAEAACLRYRFLKALDNLYGAALPADEPTEQATLHLPPYSPQTDHPVSRWAKVQAVFKGITGMLIIMLGFAMIVLPTPASFEIYTLFYFNEEDGFTLMDLISLIIIFTGVYVLISSFYKKNYSGRL
jgi:hypothetical protein